jgi:PhnB protein
MNTSKTVLVPATVQPYLIFGGRCDEALAFYQSAIDAKVVTRMLFSQSPEPMPLGSIPPGFANKVMHCAFRVGNTEILASDGAQGGATFSGFSLSITVATADEAEHVFNRLVDGGEVTMPLEPTFWSPCFGMLTDRFGVNWMVGVPGEASDA